MPRAKLSTGNAPLLPTVNADLKTWRGLDRLVLRGITKVLIVAAWSALAYNLMRSINMGWL